MLNPTKCRATHAQPKQVSSKPCSTQTSVEQPVLNPNKCRATRAQPKQVSSNPCSINRIPLFPQSVASVGYRWRIIIHPGRAKTNKHSIKHGVHNITSMNISIHIPLNQYKFNPWNQIKLKTCHIFSVWGDAIAIVSYLRFAFGWSHNVFSLRPASHSFQNQEHWWCVTIASLHLQRLVLHCSTNTTNCYGFSHPMQLIHGKSRQTCSTPTCLCLIFLLKLLRKKTQKF